MAFLLRLEPDLHARAASQAAELDLSLNRFIAVVLEDYLRRIGDDQPILSVARAAVPAAAVKAAPAASPRRPKRRKRR